VQSDWTVGASIKHLGADGVVELKGEVLEADPPRLLAYTFHCDPREGEAAEPDSRVTFQITSSYGVTKLTVIHDGFESGSKKVLEITHGWQAILSSLKTLLETGAHLPFNWKG